MGDHVTELNFDSKLQFVKVCWSLRMHLQFLRILQLWDFLIASLYVSTECKKTLTNLPALSVVSEVVNVSVLFH